MTRKNRFFIQTFGCQMNVNDSEKVAGLLTARGHERAADPARADYVFINTCAVRENAARKLDHTLGRLARLKARRPGLRIAVGGCVAQLEGTAILERSRSVDVLVGTHNLRRVPELLEADGGGRPAVDLDRRSDPFSVSEIVADRASPVRAYVTVMEGCNHVCSFCVVPRTRGPEVNRPPEDVVEEVAALVGRGYPEVMLLGQTVNAYRRGDVDFAELLARVHSVPGLRRLRFTTSHPVHVSTRLAEAFRDLPRLCPYLHLPVQSGSDRLLACMRRGYTAGQYRETVAMLREHVPGIALSTDVIVGYPGETTADFEATLALLEAVTFDSLFAFAYSPRPGTTALRLADDVPSQEKRRRLRLVNDLQQRRQRTLRASQVGKQQNVLIDTLDGPGRVSGRSPDFRIVHLDGPQEWLGRVVPVEITEAGANAFRGRAVLAGSLPAQPVH